MDPNREVKIYRFLRQSWCKNGHKIYKFSVCYMYMVELFQRQSYA